MRIRTQDPSFKSLDIEVLEKDVNEKERSITHYVSKKSIDRVGDIVLPEGVDRKNYEKNPVVLFNHDRSLPVGKNAWLKTEEDGVLAKTIFANTLFADDIYILHKGGFLNAWSIGFIPKDWDWDEKREILIYKSIELLEYSSVSVPANQDALDEAKHLCKSETAKSIFVKDLDVMYEIKEIKRDINAIIQVISNSKSLDTSDFGAKLVELKSLITSIGKKDNSDEFRTLNENIIKILGHVLRSGDVAESLADGLKEIKSIVEGKKSQDWLRIELEKLNRGFLEVKNRSEESGNWQTNFDTLLTELKNILMVSGKSNTEIKRNIDKIFSKITDQQFKIEELLSNRDSLDFQEKIETALLNILKGINELKPMGTLANKKNLDELRKRIVGGEVSRHLGK